LITRTFYFILLSELSFILISLLFLLQSIVCVIGSFYNYDYDYDYDYYIYEFVQT